MTINLITTEHSPHHSQVEWDVIKGIISQFAYFEFNKQKLTSDLFTGRLPDLSAEFIMIEIYQREFKDDYRPIWNQLMSKIPADQTLPLHLGHLSKNGVLTFAELNKFAMVIECAIFVHQNFPKVKIPHFLVVNTTDYSPVQRKVLKEFRYLVEENGELHLERHPELAELSKRLKELEERIRKTVQEWINDPKNQKSLQYNSYDVHYDRFVVPVRSDSYRSELGLIVSRSESGQTLFVEPYEVRDACNRRIELIAKIDEVITQLAMKFSLAFAEFQPLILEIYQNFLRIDFYLGKTNFAQRYALECPAIRSTPGFKFTGLFHPLIKNPIKNTADCHSNHHGIVVSGPNTGGKTVFLKSITLSYLLFYHGHFVPAAESEMYPYEGLFYFGNDLQDLKVGLSSFSGEVKNYIELIENILPTNLIMIDEIFNSTSSDEASALSMAYFDELHSRAQCHIVVSTHHQMFKTLIHQDRNYLSCHVGFDSKNMKPTYKVQWGTPGSSMAIDIFRILAQGHTSVEDVPAKALSRLSAKNVSYETLLQRVSQKQIELDQILTSSRQLEVELKNQKGAMEGVLNLKLQEELARARKELEKIMAEARNIVDEARRQEITKVKKVDDRGLTLKSQIDQLGGIEKILTPEQKYTDLSISDIKPGDTVYSVIMKKEFLVQKIDARKKEVIISKGAIKISVPVHTLAFSKKASSAHQVSVSFQKQSDAKFEYDVRGMRQSECQNLIENALGDLLAGDVPYINVIHGHGDGILKKWLRDYLKKSRDFNGQLPENGNDGETKITLK